MELTPLIPADRQLIGGYGAGLFRVSGQLYHTSILVFPGRTLEWAPRTHDELTLASFATVMAETPPVELLLLGVGARNQLIPQALRGGLRDAGIVLDAMDTGAACRTYNVLMAEGRRVAAALILLD
jgi:uncharacterized protein